MARLQGTQRSHTFRDKMPPCRIERVVWPPFGDAIAICVTRTVLEIECRSVFSLTVKPPEGVYIRLPAEIQ